ncbi:hypothetical protein SAMN02787142_7733 [Burkholderia sp. WP9]|nr:hypothetical protein SAMN02787142_7733 [Burkholderia sp. WP9]
MRGHDATRTDDAGRASGARKLLKHTQGDSGQSRRGADFLLEWWNPRACGGKYHIPPAWGVDDDIMEDMCVVFRLASRAKSYPDTLGYGPQFDAAVLAWRAELDTDNAA